MRHYYVTVYVTTPCHITMATHSVSPCNATNSLLVCIRVFLPNQPTKLPPAFGATPLIQTRTVYDWPVLYICIVTVGTTPLIQTRTVYDWPVLYICIVTVGTTPLIQTRTVYDWPVLYICIVTVSTTPLIQTRTVYDWPVLYICIVTVVTRFH